MLCLWRVWEHASKVAQEHPGLSSRALAGQTGVSQRTAARALKAAREPIGSRDAVVVGRDGKSYPASTPHQPKPGLFYGYNDLGHAKSHIRQAMLAFKQGLTQDEWTALVAWVKGQNWETHH